MNRSAVCRRIQEPLDVDIEDPVVLPAALARHAHGLDRRFSGSVAVGVGIEVLLQLRLQPPFGYRLGYAVRNRGDAQRPCSAIALGSVHPAHRRWEVAARRHPIPQLEEVIGEVPLKLRMD
jgi:hypothetical protein